jgi:hypothetical protein
MPAQTASFARIPGSLPITGSRPIAKDTPPPIRRQIDVGRRGRAIARFAAVARVPRRSDTMRHPDIAWVVETSRRMVEEPTKSNTKRRVAMMEPYPIPMRCSDTDLTTRAAMEWLSSEDLDPAYRRQFRRVIVW